MRILAMICAAFSLYGSTEIVFWHAFEGFLAERFSAIVDDFNRQSEETHIQLVFKGNYTQVFERGLQAFEEKTPPHILQVYEVATEMMRAHPERYVSVEDLMRKAFNQFNPSLYIEAVRQFYATREGEMLSLPWNASTGVLFYNKEAFRKAGLDPETPPKTWEEMEEFGQKLVQAGYKGFTTAWPAAYHLEHLCSWHNLPFATADNGFGGSDVELVFDGYYQTRHLLKLVEWQKRGIFTYQGRFVNEPEKCFTSGECAILLQGANRFPMLKKSFPIGVGFMPYWSDVEGAPYRLNIGGSSFWVLSGFTEEEYRGIAQFFSYLSSGEVQASWHQQTGYLPITEEAYHLAKKRGYYDANPAAEVAVLEVLNPHNTPFTRGIRLSNYIPVREKIIDQLEKAFSEEITPEKALQQAVIEGNQLLNQKG
jgi:sn-glycerol 3-phosphate transport system substrate-binding protein